MNSKSVTIPILVAFIGYAIGSYGYVLLRGWEITPRQWFSPLNPFTWPAKGTDPAKIPPGLVWPKAAAKKA